MAAPQIGCSTFGTWDFIRVPAPAASTTTAAGRLTVTWRCSLYSCLADRSAAAVPGTPGREARPAGVTCPTLAGYRPARHERLDAPRPDLGYVTFRGRFAAS